MSDSEDSTITYTTVSSPFGGMSDIGSPRVDGLPMMLEDPYVYVVAAFQAPQSPNYVPGPEEPEQAPLSQEFVPKPVYPGLCHRRMMYSQLRNTDPEEDEEDHEENLIDYLADGGDDDDDDDESSDDDEDDDDVEEDEDEEEEEHPALADSLPPYVHCVTARMSIRDEPPTPFWYEEEIARLLDIPSPLSP
ncbi:hypothetical protein Tco_1573040 [Tanacetum coccineum]